MDTSKTTETIIAMKIQNLSNRQSSHHSETSELNETSEHIETGEDMMSRMIVAFINNDSCLKRQSVSLLYTDFFFG